uniref:Unkown protein n=1 Tax=Riptortus pedestris TaxID=329032 RepID=R4WPE8_RIPPE|nr:unkown protein [Riptortus pedestris]
MFKMEHSCKIVNCCALYISTCLCILNSVSTIFIYFCFYQILKILLVLGHSVYSMTFSYIFISSVFLPICYHDLL